MMSWLKQQKLQHYYRFYTNTYMYMFVPYTVLPIRIKYNSSLWSMESIMVETDLSVLKPTGWGGWITGMSIKRLQKSQYNKKIDICGASWSKLSVWRRETRHPRSLRHILAAFLQTCCGVPHTHINQRSTGTAEAYEDVWRWTAAGCGPAAGSDRAALTQSPLCFRSTELYMVELRTSERLLERSSHQRPFMNHRSELYYGTTKYTLKDLLLKHTQNLCASKAKIKLW